MFHVEHMKIAVLSLILGCFLILGCTKADPEAYKTDPILQDYQTQLAATTSQLEGIEKQIADTKKEMKNAVPQTGEYGQNLKKLNDLTGRSEALAQQVRFWKIRIESRAKEAQTEYLMAFKNKKPWPDKEKVEAYYSEKRLRQAKMQWDQKARLEEYKKSTQPAGVGHGAETSEGREGSHE